VRDTSLESRSEAQETRRRRGVEDNILSLGKQSPGTGSGRSSSSGSQGTSLLGRSGDSAA
jgi:hypothetical protein